MMMPPRFFLLRFDHTLCCHLPVRHTVRGRRSNSMSPIVYCQTQSPSDPSNTHTHTPVSSLISASPLAPQPNTPSPPRHRPSQNPLPLPCPYSLRPSRTPRSALGQSPATSSERMPDLVDATREIKVQGPCFGRATGRAAARPLSFGLGVDDTPPHDATAFGWCGVLWWAWWVYLVGSGGSGGRALEGREGEGHVWSD
ncbi:hypothetical protein BKA80DRAFT_33913 [Phyllosticta citrichinensis]